MSGRRFVRRREVFCSTAQRTAFRPWLLMCSLFSAAEIGARTRLRHRRSSVAPARAVPPASAGPCAGRAVGLASRSQRAVAGSGPCGLRSRPPADRAAPVAEIGLDLRVAGLAGRTAREVSRPIRGSGAIPRARAYGAAVRGDPDPAHPGGPVAAPAGPCLGRGARHRQPRPHRPPLQGPSRPEAPRRPLAARAAARDGPPRPRRGGGPAHAARSLRRRLAGMAKSASPAATRQRTPIP